MIKLTGDTCSAQHLFAPPTADGCHVLRRQSGVYFEIVYIITRVSRYTKIMMQCMFIL